MSMTFLFPILPNEKQLKCFSTVNNELVHVHAKGILHQLKISNAYKNMSELKNHNVQ